MESMPMIFQTSTLTYEERFPVYCNEILGRCRASEVRTKFAEYVEKFVQKRGWKAIWSCSDVDAKMQENLNVLVEIINVLPEKLSSEVIICVPVVANPPITIQEAQALIRKRDNYISLMELSPVFDESGDFDQTALALEHVRFFFENIWRDWDLNGDEDYTYAARHLENRLRLYFDITQNNLSKEFIRKYNGTLSEYKQKVLHLKELRKDMSASDSEQELDTSDVLVLAKITHELEDVVRFLQSMEDLQMRYLLASVNTTKSATGQLRAYPVTMIVAEKLTAKMTKSFPDETVIEHYTSLEKAVEHSIADDNIVLYPGGYNTGALAFNHSLALSGNGEVIFECDEDDESFLTTNAASVKFNDIHFIHTSSNSCVLVVEKGQTVVKNCTFRCMADGIVVNQGAELVMEDCKVYGSMNVGITIEENSVVLLQRCEIYNNVSCNKETTGIKIFSSSTHPANVAITESCISASQGINIFDGQIIRNVEQPTDNGVLLKLENNVFECA